MAEQLSFDLPVRTALGREDFFVSPANAVAVATIEATAGWPDRKLVLSGPAGSGKTHLVHVWVRQTGAQIVAASDLTHRDIAALATGPVAIEDVPEILEDLAAQDALFHLHNLMFAQGQPLLMTGRGTPAHWNIRLPDLQSRIAGTNHVALDQPDDSLMAAVLVKLFADRQITPKADVVPYLISHIERSFDAASRIVERLDRIALAERQNLSRTLAARLLGSERPPV